jgi:hypothetical protein
MATGIPENRASADVVELAQLLKIQKLRSGRPVRLFGTPIPAIFMPHCGGSPS